MDEINFDDQDLDNLVIKDKEYYSKKRQKIALIIIPILLVLFIAAVIALVFIFKPKVINEIICQYETENDNQYINIIKYNENVDFTLIIDDVKYNKEYSHVFEKKGEHKVIFQFKKNFGSLDYFFEGNQYLLNADFSQLITKNVKSMSNLFKDCINLNNVTFDNETPNLENMSFMFYNCSSLEEVHLNIDTSKVKQMDYMFFNSSKLTYLDLSKFNLENLVNSSHMFHGCTNLAEIKFNDNTKTINLKDMNHIFDSCKSLKSINTQIFKKNNLTNLNYVFKECISLNKLLDLSNFESKEITELIGTFYNCYNLPTITFDNFDTKKVIRTELYLIILFRYI